MELHLVLKNHLRQAEATVSIIRNAYANRDLNLTVSEADKFGAIHSELKSSLKRLEGMINEYTKETD